MIAMSSPFPGMNPYLEQEEVWHDFHERFVTTAAEVLGAQVGPEYIVKIDEHVYIHELPENSRRLAGRGDVTMAGRDAGGASLGAAATAAPALVQLPMADRESQAFIEI